MNENNDNHLNNNTDMQLSLNLSNHVVNTINALPEKERAAVTAALESEFLLGEDPREHLTPFEALLYSIIRFYVQRDRMRG